MPAKRSVRPKASASQRAAGKPARSARPRKPSWLDSPFATGAIALVVISVVGVVMLVAAREASDPADATVPSTIVEQPAQVTKVATPNKAAATLAKAAPANSAVPKVPDAPPAASAAALSPIVTVTGCLDRGGKGFRLMDTSGEDAPKSRSWKSGFLKKSSAPIAVVDATNAREVADHVGQRVSVTGVLTDRNMRVFSLRRIAASCR